MTKQRPSSMLPMLQILRGSGICHAMAALGVLVMLCQCSPSKSATNQRQQAPAARVANTAADNAIPNGATNADGADIIAARSVRIIVAVQNPATTPPADKFAVKADFLATTAPAKIASFKPETIVINTTLPLGGPSELVITLAHRNSQVWLIRHSDFTVPSGQGEIILQESLDLTLNGQESNDAVTADQANADADDLLELTWDGRANGQLAGYSIEEAD